MTRRMFPLVRHAFPWHFLLIYSIAGLFMTTAFAQLPPHPRLLLNAEGIAALKSRIASAPFARQYWNALKTRVDASLDKKINLPERGGNWTHWYICPKHAVRLRKGKQTGPWQWTHICPADQEEWVGDPTKPNRDFDGCVISQVHHEYSDLVRDCGLVYQVTGEKKYADKARDILLAYVEKYPTYPLHNVQGEAKLGGAKVGSQTLDESTWMIPVCQGADLVWDVLSEADRRQIADKLLLVSAREVILPHHLKAVHNIQCWKNSAVGLIGLLLDDKELIDAAINDPERGYRTQLAKGVLADGPWWEGAWGYHFYTLSALWPLAEAGRNCNIELLEPELKKMFDAPLVFAMPDLVLPNFNDSSLVPLTKESAIYEWAYARFGDADYARVISMGDRQNNLALCFGVADLPKGKKKSDGSSNHEASGYAMLQNANTWLGLKYGPDGGGHGHFDKLHFILYRDGNIVMPDPGTTRYGTPLHNSWYRTSIAHNTLVVDERRQNAAEGKSLAFGGGETPFIMADAGNIAPGVKFVRTTALLDPDLIVVIDDVQSDQPHLLDLAIHVDGEWNDLPAGVAWHPPDKEGYKHLIDATNRTTDQPTRLSIRSKLDTATLSVAGGEETNVITALGLGMDPTQRVPVALLRRRASSTRYVWAIALAGQVVDLKSTAAGADVRWGAKGWNIKVDLKGSSCTVQPINRPE